jgi:uncharacterized membrane protein YoaK (UPF0700 family)
MQSAAINAHPETIRFPLMEKPLIGFLLAFMAGTMDAWTLGNAQTFATVQSGNVVSSGYWLVQGDWPKFGFALFSVIAFGIGSLACGALMTSMLRKKRIYTPQVLFAQAAILAALGAAALRGDADPHHIAYAVSFVAGAQGNAFHKSHGMLYGNVAVTFVVQMAFNFLIQAAFSRKGINGEPNLMWSGLFFLVLLGFAMGGAIGLLIDAWTDGVALFLPAVIALVLAVIALGERGRPIDPTPGGLIG